ncbi:MAG: GGDEF domain-containing protein [Nitrospinae bacterium]|nr:GGDEF domain-containing protein [Nitrospinota bacterium]
MVDNVTTRAIVRQVIPFLVKKSIPLTPENYRVWFEYFSGRKEEIKKRLDELLESDTAFSDELNEKLYEQFFVRSLEKESAEKVQREIDAAELLGSKINMMVVNLMRDILAGANSTTGFGEKLKKYQTTMQKMEGIDDVRSLLTSILKDTNEAAAETTKVHKKLEKTSDELETLQIKLTEARNDARTDNLTKLWNRRFFDETLAATVTDAKAGKNVSLIFLDVDFFKKFNDNYGHLIGDKLLVHLAKEIKKKLEQHSHVCRYGGEEFAVILPNTALKRATELADVIRVEVEGMSFTVRGTDVDVSISAGVAQIRPDDTPKSVVERADTAMYAAKTAGRNNVKTENDVKAGAQVAKN